MVNSSAYALAIAAVIGVFHSAGPARAQTAATKPALSSKVATRPARVATSRPASDPVLAPVVDDPRLPRVLLIGDSISMGYTLPVRELLKGKANVHRPPENCGPTIRGIEKLGAWLGDGSWNVIHFNFGLHDLKYVGDKHQVSLEDYEKNLRAMVKRLKQTKARLIWCSTTPAPAGAKNPLRRTEDVLAYNAVAAKIMKEEGVAIDDLYVYALPRIKDIQRPANVHFSERGSKFLARRVADSILKALNGEGAKAEPSAPDGHPGL